MVCPDPCFWDTHMFVSTFVHCLLLLLLLSAMHCAPLHTLFLLKVATWALSTPPYGFILTAFPPLPKQTPQRRPLPNSRPRSRRWKSRCPAAKTLHHRRSESRSPRSTSTTICCRTVSTSTVQRSSRPSPICRSWRPPRLPLVVDGKFCGRRRRILYLKRRALRVYCFSQHAWRQYSRPRTRLASGVRCNWILENSTTSQQNH